MPDDWLNDLKDWVREFPCVIVRLEEEEWDHLADSRRGLGEFTMARSHAYFERVRVPTLSFTFGVTHSFVNGRSVSEDVCLVGKLSSRSRVTALETRIKVSRTLALKPMSEGDFANLLDDSVHGRNLRGRLSSSDSVIPLSPELSRVLIDALARSARNRTVLKTVASGLKITKSFSSLRALQDDAIQTALRAFGLESQEGARELDVADGEASALASVPVLEDTVIQHDARHVPGFDLVGGDITGRAVFERPNGRLEIFTANRLPLESVFGVDLIYLNLSQKNLVMVQYKMLERISASEVGGNGDWIYRPNDDLKSEVARMEKFAGVAGGSSIEYRLNCQPFYLKFVKRNGLLKNGSILTPLAHFKQFIQSPLAQGPRGGIRISYETLAGSYMRQGTFIDLMQAGYIGSYAEDTKNFQALIEAVVAGNRSVVAVRQIGVPAEMADQNHVRSRYQA
jgi:hypothetical protein